MSAPVDVASSTAPRAADGATASSARRRGSGALRASVVLVSCALVLVAVVGASLALGVRAIDPAQVWLALTSPDAGNADHNVILQLRVPRTVIGLMAGVALGMAGVLIQGVTRNPIADPGLLGINAGASLAVVCAISFLGVTSAFGFIWFAFAGAADRRRAGLRDRPQPTGATRARRAPRSPHS